MQSPLVHAERALAFPRVPRHIPNVPTCDTVTAANSPLTEALLDRCVVERELGRNGMGTVYLARDLHHERRRGERGLMVSDWPRTGGMAER